VKKKTEIHSKIGLVNQLNLVLVSGIYYPDIGGPATYLPRLTARLIEGGSKVSTLSLTESVGTSRPEENWQRIFIQRKLPKPLRMFKVVSKLIELSRGSDGVYANGLHEEVGIASIFGSRALVAKIVGDPIWERHRNSTKTKMTISEFQSIQLPFSLRLQRKLLVWSLNRFKYITTPSKELADIVKYWGVKSPIKVIQNGITCRTNNSNSKQVGIVSISRLVTWKNIDVLIRACANLNLRLVVVGDGPERENLEKLSRDLNADVKFLGELDNSEVISVLDKAEIYALISDYEGLSFSLLEAMMAGKPIVVSSNQGNLDVIENGQTGLVVPIRDLQRTIDAITKLLNDKNFAQVLGDRAQLNAKESYCEQSQLDLMIELISESNKA